MRSSRSGLRVNNVRIVVATSNEWAGRCVARSSRCCVWLFPVSTAGVGLIDGRRSPTWRRGSSSTWPPSVVFGRCRSGAYRHHLDRFEDYLMRIGVTELPEVSPTVLAAFVAERRAAGLAKTTVRQTCGVLRVFLRYAHREGVLAPGPQRHGAVAAGLPAVRCPAVDFVGRGGAGARRCGSPDPVRETGLRDLVAVGQLRFAGP